MTTLTIEIPDRVTDDVLKFLKEKDVVIKAENEKILDDLTVEEYRNNFIQRSKQMRLVVSKHL